MNTFANLNMSAQVILPHKQPQSEDVKEKNSF